MENENSTREKLIQATIELLKTKDASQISIREIAKMAEQNSAAISYYFGGKNQLITEAMGRHRRTLLGLFEDVLEKKEMIRSEVEDFAKELMRFLCTYEGAYRTGRQLEMENIRNGLTSCDNNVPDIQIKALVHMTKLLQPTISDELALIKAIQFFSAIAYPAMYIDLYEALHQPSSKDEFIEKYIRNIVTSLMTI